MLIVDMRKKCVFFVYYPFGGLFFYTGLHDFARSFNHRASSTEPFICSSNNKLWCVAGYIFCSYFLLHAARTVSIYFPHDRWFRNIHKDQGPANDETRSFTVPAPFDFLLYGAPPAVLKALAWAGLTAQVGETQIVHNFSTGGSFAFLVSLSGVRHIKTSAAPTTPLLREVE